MAPFTVHLNAVNADNAGQYTFDLAAAGYPYLETHKFRLVRMIHTVATGAAYLFLVTSENADDYVYGSYATTLGTPIALTPITEEDPVYNSLYAPIFTQQGTTLTIYAYTSVDDGLTYLPLTTARDDLVTEVTYVFEVV